MTNNQKSLVNTHILVFEKIKTSYCFVPKVGCTSWKHFLLLLLGIEVPDNKLLTVHRDFINRYGVRLLSQYDEKEIESILNNKTYKHIMLTRHPFDRLLSAYQDKFLGNGKMYAGNVKKLIKIQFGRDPENEEEVFIICNTDFTILFFSTHTISCLNTLLLGACNIIQATS